MKKTGVTNMLKLFRSKVKKHLGCPSIVLQKHWPSKVSVISSPQSSLQPNQTAAWKFYNEHKGKIGWDLVVINPPLVKSTMYSTVMLANTWCSWLFMKGRRGMHELCRFIKHHLLIWIAATPREFSPPFST